MGPDYVGWYTAQDRTNIKNAVVVVVVLISLWSDILSVFCLFVFCILQNFRSCYCYVTGVAHFAKKEAPTFPQGTNTSAGLI